MYILDKLARESPVRARGKVGDDGARLLRLDELARLVLADEDGVVLGAHGLLAALADQLLHVRVDLARRDGDARDVGLLDGQVRHDVVGGRLAGAVGAPGRVGALGRARGDPDDAALGLAQLGDDGFDLGS